MSAPRRNPRRSTSRVRRSLNLDADMEHTPRNLIEGMLSVQDTAVPVARSRARVMPPPSSSGKKSRPRRPSLGVPRLDTVVEKLTPRSNILGMLEQEPERTTVVAQTHGNKSSTRGSLPDVEGVNINEVDYVSMETSVVAEQQVSPRKQPHRRRQLVLALKSPAPPQSLAPRHRKRKGPGELVFSPDQPESDSTPEPSPRRSRDKAAAAAEGKDSSPAEMERGSSAKRAKRSSRKETGEERSLQEEEGGSSSKRRRRGTPRSNLRSSRAGASVRDLSNELPSESVIFPPVIAPNRVEVSAADGNQTPVDTSQHGDEPAGDSLRQEPMGETSDRASSSGKGLEISDSDLPEIRSRRSSKGTPYPSRSGSGLRRATNTSTKDALSALSRDEVSQTRSSRKRGVDSGHKEDLLASEAPQTARRSVDSGRTLDLEKEAAGEASPRLAGNWPSKTAQGASLNAGNRLSTVSLDFAPILSSTRREMDFPPPPDEDDENLNDDDENMNDDDENLNDDDENLNDDDENLNDDDENLNDDDENLNDDDEEAGEDDSSDRSHSVSPPRSAGGAASRSAGLLKLPSSAARQNETSVSRQPPSASTKAGRSLEKTSQQWSETMNISTPEVDSSPAIAQPASSGQGRAASTVLSSGEEHVDRRRSLSRRDSPLTLGGQSASLQAPPRSGKSLSSVHPLSAGRRSASLPGEPSGERSASTPVASEHRQSPRTSTSRRERLSPSMRSHFTQTSLPLKDTSSVAEPPQISPIRGSPSTAAATAGSSLSSAQWSPALQSPPLTPAKRRRKAEGRSNPRLSESLQSKPAPSSATRPKPLQWKPAEQTSAASQRAASAAPQRSNRSNLQPSREPLRRTRRPRKPKDPKEHIPLSTIKALFTHFTNRRVAPDALLEVERLSAIFWKHAAEDLEAYAVHRRRKTIDESDIKLLMRRQRFVTDDHSFNAAVEKLLPMELRRQIIPMARSGNKIEL